VVDLFSEFVRACLPVVVSLRRCVGSRNRPFAALTPVGQRSFPWDRGRGPLGKHLARPGPAGGAGSFRRGACRL